MPGKTWPHSSGRAPLPVSITHRSCCFLQSIDIAGHKRNFRGKHSSVLSLPRWRVGRCGGHEFWKDRLSPRWPLWAWHGACWLKSSVGVLLGAVPSECSLLPCSWNLVLGCLAVLPLVAKLLRCTAVCLWHLDRLPGSDPRSGDGDLTHKSKARRPMGPAESEGQMLHLLTVTVCNSGKSPTEIYGALGVQCVSAWTGEKGLELCVSKPAICGDCRHPKSVLRISGGHGYPHRR